MGYNIVLTTAEDIVSVVDAIVAKGQNADKSYISDYTGIATEEQVTKALIMALDLNLIAFNDSTSTYYANSFLAEILVTTTTDEQKAAIMRLILEQYYPYKVFKTRYSFTHSIEQACHQTKILCALESHERDIKNTLISVATYAKALKSKGANLYSFAEENNTFSLIETLLSEHAIFKATLQLFFGEELYDELDYSTIINPLSFAFQKSKDETIDTRSIVVNTANAFESFLDSFARIKNIQLKGANGIIQKKNVLSTVLSKKHKGIIEYIGQIRNAADHGADSDENNQIWTISRETAIVYPYVVSITIKSIMEREKGFIEV